MAGYININEPVLHLTEDELLDYIKCPNLFYFKYRTKIPSVEKKTLGKLVREVINYYYMKLLDGRAPNIESIKRKWDSLCDADKDALSGRQILEGYGLLKLFDKYCREKKLIVADFSSSYEIVFPGSIIVTGSIGAITLIGKKLELFVVETGSKHPEQRLLDMSIRNTIKCLAASRTFKGYELNCVNVLHLKSLTENRTYRSSIQYSRLEKAVQSIGRAIKEEIYYPRESFECARCPYKNFCGYS